MEKQEIKALIQETLDNCQRIYLEVVKANLEDSQFYLDYLDEINRFSMLYREKSDKK